MSVGYLDELTSPITLEMKYWLKSPGITALIASARMGKTATLYFLLDRIFEGVPINHYRYPEQMKAKLPDGQTICYSLMDLKGGEVISFDDTALWAFSRNFSSNFSKQFIQWLTISGHWPVSCIFTVQNTRLLDILSMSVIRFTEVQKFTHEINMDMERDDMVTRMKFGNMAIMKVAYLYGLDLRALAFIHAPFGKVIHTPLVDFWSDDLSTPQKDYRFQDAKEILI